MWILHAAMFYVVALYPVYLMARFEPDDIVHYGFLRWIAVVLVLYWAASQLLFTERPGETRTGRMLLAVTAAVVLVIGVFSPIVSFSFIGDVDYFREGYGDGYILLIMALLSLALAVTGRWKQVLIPALGSLAVILWTFLGVQDTITQARTGGASELTGNPHEGALAASVMQSIQWEWGWVLLFAGSGLLLYSATRRDEWEAASPPLVSVAVDDEPETAAAEATGAAETEAEIEAAAAAPADDAALAPAESAEADEPAEPTAEAPAEQAAAADPPAEQAEDATAPPPEAPEPAAQESTEETAAPAPSDGAEEQKADEAETAAEAEASTQEPEPQPAEPAAKPDPQPEAAAAAETAPEEKAPAATGHAADVAEAAPAPADAPAEAATEKSESAPADAGKAASTEEAESAATEPAAGGTAEPAASDAKPPTDAKG